MILFWNQTRFFSKLSLLTPSHFCQIRPNHTPFFRFFFFNRECEHNSFFIIGSFRLIFPAQVTDLLLFVWNQTLETQSNPFRKKTSSILFLVFAHTQELQFIPITGSEFKSEMETETVGQRYKHGKGAYRMKSSILRWGSENELKFSKRRKQLLFSGTERPDTQISLSQQPMTHSRY